jgi:photosystem II stability/assembly factor-like uncharacterized protein
MRFSIGKKRFTKKITVVIIVEVFFCLFTHSQCIDPRNGFPCFPGIIYYLNSNTGFVGGVDSKHDLMFVKTTQDGNSWYSTYDNFIPRKIQYLNGKLYASSINTLIISTNEGSSWLKKHINVEPYGAVVQFATDDTAYAVCGAFGSPGLIAKTTNAGDYWFFLPVDTILGPLFVLSFINASTGIVAGSQEISMTTNGGTNWFRSPESMDYYMIGVKMFTPKLVFGYGMTPYEQAIVKSTNGGLNWRKVYSFNYNIARAFFVDTLNYYACGYWPGSLSAIHPDDTTAIEKFFSMEVLFNDVFAINKDTAWAVGHMFSFGPIFMKTTDGGMIWLPLSEMPQVPLETKIIKNYPNPFNAKTTIRYQISEPEDVNIRIEIFDILGRNIKTFFEGKHKSYGYYEVEFDGTGLPSGIYFGRVVTYNHRDNKGFRMVLLR